jgi:hypothetical protein
LYVKLLKYPKYTSIIETTYSSYGLIFNTFIPSYGSLDIFVLYGQVLKIINHLRTVSIFIFPSSYEKGDSILLFYPPRRPQIKNISTQFSLTQKLTPDTKTQHFHRNFTTYPGNVNSLNTFIFQYFLCHLPEKWSFDH